MFTWICPKCGREVGPSYNECPFCADAARGPAPPLPPVPVGPAAPVQAPPPPPQYAAPQYTPPQPQYVAPAPAPAQPQYVPPQYVPPQYVPPQAPVAPVAMAPPPSPPEQVYYVGADDHPNRRIPGWLAALLAFAAVAIIAYSVVWYSKGSRGKSGATDAKSAALAKANAAGNPYKKYLELTGFRIGEAAGKKLQVQFLAVNHGGADMTDIEGTITLRVKGAADDTPACTFKFRVSSVPGNSAKEVVVTEFIQKRKFFEMPDWQFIEPLIELTSTE